jgi:cytochrome c-type biogenesis protein CcmE
MSPRAKRGLLVLGLLGGVAAATTLVINAFSSNLVFFYSPTQVAAEEAPKYRTFRIGGLVAEGSVQRTGVDVRFKVTDTAQAITVQYTGILPDLFQEGKGVVAQGQLGQDGVFRAREVLAKHDENYMPPEAAAAIEQAKRSAREGTARGTTMPPIYAGTEGQTASMVPSGAGGGTTGGSMVPGAAPGGARP